MLDALVAAVGIARAGHARPSALLEPVERFTAQHMLCPGAAAPLSSSVAAQLDQLAVGALLQ
eukprot:7004987-Lingulodinium_polyedra.AAC.1